MYRVKVVLRCHHPVHEKTYGVESSLQKQVVIYAEAESSCGDEEP